MSENASGHERRSWVYWLVLSALINVTLTGLVVLALRWPTPSAIRIETPERQDTSNESLVPVYVSGAVGSPGVYWLREGALVAEALEAAGGATDEADLCTVNLAQRLRDGTHVHVPREGENPQVVIQAGNDDERIDINTASAEDLESLPGIGSVKANDIIAYREEHGSFGTVEELRNVEGIGAQTLERLRPLVVVR